MNNNNNNIVNISECYINKDQRNIVYKIANNPESYTLDLKDVDYTDPHKLQFIHDANRNFMKKIYQFPKENRKNWDGCLPINCLLPQHECLVSTIDDRFISPKYLINCFINILKSLLSNNDDNILFDRDSEDIVLPATPERMRQIMMESIDTVPQSFGQSLNSPGNDKLNVDTTLITLQQFLQQFIKQFQTLQHVFSKKMENIQNDTKIKRRLNIVGRLNVPNTNQQNVMEQENILDAFILKTCESADIVHCSIKQYKEEILQRLMTLPESNIKTVIEIIQQSPNITIYENEKISFPLMFGTLGEVFHAMFMCIFPKISMTTSIIGSLYYCTVIKELKLFHKYNKQIQLPIILRLIYSCIDKEFHFISDNQKNTANKYMNEKFPSIYKQIVNCQKNGILATSKDTTDNNFDENLKFICNVGQKFNFKDKEFIDALYITLCANRKRTYEFYLIAALGTYANGLSRCYNTNKINRDLNERQFIAPLHRVLTLLYLFVNSPSIQNYKLLNDMGDIDFVIVDQFLTGFAEIHSEELSKALKEMFEIIGKMSSQHIKE